MEQMYLYSMCGGNVPLLKDKDNSNVGNPAVIRLLDEQRTAYSGKGIVKGLIERDPEVCKIFVKKYGQFIDRRVWRLLGGDSEHDDIVQTVFIKIFASIKTLKDPDSLEGWIGVTTINVVRSVLRSRKHRRIVRLFKDDEVFASRDMSGEAALYVSRVYGILESLKPEFQIVFAMRFIEGADLKTIASSTDCSIATVKRRLAKARASFLAKASRDTFLVSLVDKDFSPLSNGGNLFGGGE
jgi:RNA polymerase sigma-70 factor (ECF subfamily)